MPDRQMTQPRKHRSQLMGSSVWMASAPPDSSIFSDGNIRKRIKSMVKDFERDVFVSLGAVIDFVVEIKTRFKRTDFRKLFSAA